MYLLGLRAVGANGLFKVLPPLSSLIRRKLMAEISMGCMLPWGGFGANPCPKQDRNCII